MTDGVAEGEDPDSVSVTEAEDEDSDSVSVTEVEDEDSDSESVPDAEDDFVVETEVTLVVGAEDACVLEADDESALVEEDEDDSDAGAHVSKHSPGMALTKLDGQMVLPAALQVSLYALSAASTLSPQSFLI